MAAPGGDFGSGSGPDAGAPEIAVVVPSHDRPARLQRLLDGLAGQAMPAGSFEVVVAEDSAGPATGRLLETHQLARQGALRHVRFEPGTGAPTRQRNAGWRASRAPLIAFTDDDCRPADGWLEELAAVARAHPGAFVQGATRPDPDELHRMHRMRTRTQVIDPPTLHAETCNVLYPRELLERLHGFDERIPWGDDTELALRAVAAGARQVAAPQAVVYHAVVVQSVRRTLRSALRWQHLPYVVKRHPVLRRHLFLGLFWKRTHAALLLALAGLLLPRRRLVLALPWAFSALPAYGPSPRGRARAVAELPLRALVDACELAVAIRGSVRYRTVFL